MDVAQPQFNAHCQVPLRCADVPQVAQVTPARSQLPFSQPSNAPPYPSALLFAFRSRSPACIFAIDLFVLSLSSLSVFNLFSALSIYLGLFFAPPARALFFCAILFAFGSTIFVTPALTVVSAAFCPFACLQSGSSSLQTRLHCP